MGQMEHREFVKAITTLLEVYRQAASAPAMNVYWHTLKGRVSLVMVKRCCEHAAAHRKFMPSPAEILEDARYLAQRDEELAADRRSAQAQIAFVPPDAIDNAANRAVAAQIHGRSAFFRPPKGVDVASIPELPWARIAEVALQAAETDHGSRALDPTKPGHDELARTQRCHREAMRLARQLAHERARELEEAPAA